MNLPPSIMDIISQADAANAKNAAEVVRLQKVLEEQTNQLKCELATVSASRDRVVVEANTQRERADKNYKGYSECSVEVERLKQQLHDARIENSHQAAEIEKLKSTPFITETRCIFCQTDRVEVALDCGECGRLTPVITSMGLDILSQTDATNIKNAADVERLTKALDNKADDHNRTLAELKEVKQWLHEAQSQNAHKAAEIKRLSADFEAECEQYKKDIEEIKRVWAEEVKILKERGADARADRDEYLDALGIANTKNTQMSITIKEQALQIQKLSEELERVGRIVGAQNPLSDELLKLVSAMNSSNAGAVKGEPSRLEIAASFITATFMRYGVHSLDDTIRKTAVEEADALIAFAKNLQG